MLYHIQHSLLLIQHSLLFLWSNMAKPVIWWAEVGKIFLK